VLSGIPEVHEPQPNLQSLYNLPTAKYVVVTATSGWDELEKLTFPIVMKPIDLRHGKGVVVGITSITEAHRYFETQKYKYVICEEMLQGTEYRVVCVDYKFVAAAFRKPAHVIGDGEHTIRELIDLKNQHPWRGSGHEANLTLIEVDDQVLHLLASNGFTLDSVPAPQQEVLLRKTANLSTGGEAWDVTESVSEENKRLFEQIARVCDLNTIGIDVMCNSLETPIVDQPHAGVVEVNASPGLRMHHYPIQGQRRNVAQAILEMAIKYAHTQSQL
jgi:cyanophycin synthetase